MPGLDPTLNKHFVVSRGNLACPKHWRSERFLGRNILTGRDVRRYPVFAEGNKQVGLALGWIIGGDGILGDGTQLRIDGSACSLLEASFEWCGRYIVIGTEEPSATPMLLTDSGGLLSAVYAPDTETVASTPQMIAELYALAPDPDIRKAFPIPERSGWIPFGLTPVDGVRRLLPNFALDLDNFETRRVWPTAVDLKDSMVVKASDPSKRVAEIFDVVASHCAGLAKEERARAHLTAGYDSRMVMAALMPSGIRRPFVTISIPGAAAQIDVSTARRLARAHNFPHEVRDLVSPVASDIDEWHRRTGNCVSDSVAQLSTTLKSWDVEEIQITGTCGEVARAFYWDRSDIGGPRPSPEEIVSRLGVGDSPRVTSAATQWLSTLPELSRPLIWDLAYIEQRLGCWAGPSVYGSFQRFPSLSPFNSRQIFSMMLGLPDAFRAANGFADAFLKLGHPELAQVGVNTPIGLDKLRYPQLVVKGLMPKSVRRVLKRVIRRS